jgi:hypothetical protein
MVPIPKVASFAELNRLLLAECQQDDRRQVDGQSVTIGEAWELERHALLPLPARDYQCCVTRPVSLTPYSQVESETNRYSVAADKAQLHLVLRAYPFRVDILYLEEVIASHERCYGKHQDVFNPLHYLPLLEQRPGAFQHAKPLRRWRETWPPVYEQLLAHLQAEKPEGSGVREFIRIPWPAALRRKRQGGLNLHRTHAAEQIEQAIRLALEYGCAHLDGVILCLHQLQQPALPLPVLDMSDQPYLSGIGTQPLDLGCYDRLFEARLCEPLSSGG